MADFSLTTLFVVPVGQTELPSSGSTQDLTPGQVGFFKHDYTVATAGDIADARYFYVAQGRANSYLQGSKRSDKIKGCPTGGGCNTNVTEWYKVSGCGTPAVQITDVAFWKVKCGESVSLTLRGHSSYIDTLYFNGFTRSVTVQVPCCGCDADPCTIADVPALIDMIIDAATKAIGSNTPENISFNSFYTFERIGDDEEAILRISGKPLTKYGVPCDVAAFPWEYDRMWFRTFVYEGPATTSDFFVADNCDVVATPIVVQRSSYPTGTAEEIAQLEKNFYSYQAGYLKHLYRMNGYNPNFESHVREGVVYDTFYIKFNEYDRSAYQWGAYIHEDAMVIIAVPNADTVDNAAISGLVQDVLVGALGDVLDDNICITTTTTAAPDPAATTTTTTTLIP
jgi:hypothetical protein